MRDGESATAAVSSRRANLHWIGAELEEVLGTASPLVAVETNFSGQLAQVVRQHTGVQCDHLVVKYNGRPIAGRRLYEAFATILAGKAEKKIVLRNPNE